MARSVERIEREIAQLEQAAAALAAEFNSCYSNYLTTLGKAVRQQLIQATYHICTQGYPENFLNLTLKGKQELQETLRQLGDRAKEELLTLLEPDLGDETPESTAQEEEEQEAEEEAFSEEGEEVFSNSPPSDEIANEEEEEAFSNSPPSEAIAPISIESISDPDTLDHWQENLESGIGKVLHRISRDTNRLLQTSKIVAQKLPEMFLEAAAKVPNSDAVAGPPNLINITIETENPEDLQGLKGIGLLASSPLHIMAIHLRVSDIEFADSSLGAIRRQIRHLSNQLNALKREYHKKQRERAVAEAESAWRSTWLDR